MANFTSNHTQTSGRVLLEPLDTWYWVIRGIIAILTITGNGLVIYLIVSKRRLWATNNWFVLSLAVADFCVGLFITTTGAACTFHFRCDWRLQLVFYNFFLFSSTTNLWTVAIDRYIGIVYSLRYRSLMTNTRVVLAVAASWSTSFVAAFVRLLWLHDQQLYRAIDKYYRVIADFFLGAVSCVVLTFIYLRVLLISRSIAKKIVAQANEITHNYKPNNVRSKRHARLNLSTKFFGSLVLLFVVCNSVSIYISLCKIFKVGYLNPTISTLAYLLVHCNSAMNFAAYAFMKRDIRRELRRKYRFSQFVELSYLSRGELTLTRGTQ